jgi:hypothetical protein
LLQLLDLGTQGRQKLEQVTTSLPQHTASMIRRSVTFVLDHDHGSLRSLPTVQPMTLFQLLLAISMGSQDNPNSLLHAIIFNPGSLAGLFLPTFEDGFSSLTLSELPVAHEFNNISSSKVLEV